MSYFSKNTSIKIMNKFMAIRRNRPTVLGFRKVNQIIIGDIMTVYFHNKGIVYSFIGICISIRNKRFRSPNTSFTLRNVLSSIGVEIIIPFFEMRVFTPSFHDFKRKKFHYKRSKLNFLRNKLNKFSKVK